MKKLIPIPDEKTIQPSQLASIREDGLTFIQCVKESIKSMDFVQAFNKLNNTSLAMPKDPIIQMIDESTGKQKEEIQLLLKFIWNYVFIRVETIKSNEK
jgi:hypothetical protein